MFCRYCGKELPDDAKFCNGCGKSVNVGQQEPLPEPPQKERSNIRADTTPATVKRPIRKNQSRKVAIIAIIVLCVIVLGVFCLRFVNESAMKQQVPQNIFEDSREDIITHYDTVMAYPYESDPGYTYGCDFTTFEITKGNKSNTFYVTGELNVVDISKDDRPAYKIDIDGTITTNFLRSDYSLEWNMSFQNPPVDTSGYIPDTENNDSDEPEYGEHGELTDNSPNLPVNLSEPFGYYEKADGMGGFSIEYISDDDSVMIEYYSDGQPGYYGGRWFEADFHMSCDSIDFSSDNVLEFIDSNGNSIIRFDAYESYITITASKSLYGVTVDRMNGSYYCKVQSSILQ